MKGKHGEPWVCHDLGIVTRRQVEQPHHEVVVAQFEDHDHGVRSAACVSALDGCPDPVAAVAALRLWYKAQLAAGVNPAFNTPALLWLDEEGD